jgi:LysM repeat protein
MRKLAVILGLVLLLQLAMVPASAAAPPPAGGFWHYVRHGETLFSIGRLYGVNAYSICSANGLGNCNHIRVGQALWVPSRGQPSHGPRQPQRAGMRCTDFHRVGRGETLYSIGRQHRVSPWAIASANGIYNLNLIYSGQRLCIPDP